MFDTFERQYLNELSEGKVGDFASPQTFHASKIQRLGHYHIKPSAQVSGKLVVPILALVRDFTIQSRELPDSTPPIVRAFDFTRKAFC